MPGMTMAYEICKYTQTYTNRSTVNIQEARSRAGCRVEVCRTEINRDRAARLAHGHGIRSGSVLDQADGTSRVAVKCQNQC